MDSPLPSGEDGLAVPEALGDQRLNSDLQRAEQYR